MIVESIVLGVTAIIISSYRFSRYVLDREDRLEREEYLRLNPPPPPPPPPPPQIPKSPNLFEQKRKLIRDELDYWKSVEVNTAWTTTRSEALLNIQSLQQKLILLADDEIKEDKNDIKRTINTTAV